MSDDEQIQSSSDEILNQKLQENVEIVCTQQLEQRLVALGFLITELKKSTSSMTDFPKPMKYLIQFLPQLKNAFDTFTNQEYRHKLGDLLSLLSLIEIDSNDSTNNDILTYRIASPIDNIGSWGHSYVRCLTLALIRAYCDEQYPYSDKLPTLVDQIAKYYMEHNDEPDACDLLLKVDRLDEIIDLVDEESHKRVCIYLLQNYNYLHEPENISVLRTVEKIYEKLGKTAQAMVMALKLNDFQLMERIFNECQDPSVRKQLAFLLARQLIVFEDIEDDEILEIATNIRLYSRFEEVSKRLQKSKPKTPDDVLQLQATLGNRQNSRGEKALSLIAKSFVAGFHNAGIKQDHYYTAPRGGDCIQRNRPSGKAVAVASLAMLHLWDVETGLNELDKYTKSNDPSIQMGALTGVGIVSSAIRSEFDPAKAILSDYINHEDMDVKVGAIFGFAMAYAGSARQDILDIFDQLLQHTDIRVRAYSTLAIGLIFVGTRDENATNTISEVILGLLENNFSEETERANEAIKDPNEKYIPILALGLGLLFLGQQNNCETAIEILNGYDSLLARFTRITIIACAYAGTGDVLKVQDMLRICSGEDSMEHAAAVLGIAVITIGDPINCQMVKRMFELLLQYGKDYARLAIPIGLALTSISQPLPEIVDALHRIGHDIDPRIAMNAAVAIGLLSAGTQNSRAIGILHQLEVFHKANPSVTMLLQIAEGMTHLGQGLMTLSPTYGDSMLIHPVALGSLMTIAFACIHTESLIVAQDPILLYFIAPAIGPRFLVTLNEDLEIFPLPVRVGSAIDVVGQAGKPRSITGFQTLDTPIILAAGQRAEIIDDDDIYEILSPILEGFVIVRKKSASKAE